MNESKRERERERERERGEKRERERERESIRLHFINCNVLIQFDTIYTGMISSGFCVLCTKLPTGCLNTTSTATENVECKGRLWKPKVQLSHILVSLAFGISNKVLNQQIKNRMT